MAFQDIRRSRRFLSATDIAVILGILVLSVALLVLNIYLARTFKGGEWLFLRWSGVQAFLFEHAEPYGSGVAEKVQALVYGREAFLAEYPYALNDPFYILLLYVPLAFFFSDFAIVHGIWMLLSQAALVAIVALTIRLSAWEPPRWLYIALMGFGLLSYFSVNSFLSGSPSIFLTLIYISILVALQSFSDELAGTLLFLVAYQWEVGTLFFLFVLVFVIANRRWNVFVGFGMTLIVLAIISFISNSDWLFPYVRAVLFDWNRGTNYNFMFTVSYIFPAVSLSVGSWLIVALVVLVLFEAIRSVNEYVVHVTWVALLSLSLNPMMGFAIFPSNHVVLLPAFVLIVALAWERWKNRRILVTIILLVLMLIFSYGIYFQSTFTSLRLFSDLLRILPPILATVGLYWMRWWAVRPPRIWADQFGVRK